MITFLEDFNSSQNLTLAPLITIIAILLTLQVKLYLSLRITKYGLLILEQVTHVGSCVLSDKNIISNVFYLPEFKYKFMFVSKLSKELDTFFHNFYIFQDLSSGKVKEVGKEAGSLYTQSHDRGEKEIVLTLNQGPTNMDLWHK